MALTTSPNLWPGEYVKGVNTAAVLGGDTVKSGLWRIEEGIEDTVIIKLMDYTSRLAVVSLCNAVKGTSNTMSDLAIATSTYTIHDYVCKEDILGTNYDAYQQQKGVFNKVIPQEVLEAYVRNLANHEKMNLEKIRWSGDLTSLDPVLSLQDGVIVKAVADGSFIPVTAIAITSSNVIAEINKVIAATPQEIRMAPNYKLVISYEIYIAYQQAVAANQATAMFALMGQNAVMNLQLTMPSYVGQFIGTNIPMYMAGGLSAGYPGVMLAGLFSNDETGNLIYVTDAITDLATISVMDRQSVFPSEPFMDIVWQFRQGVEVARYPELILYI